MTDPGTGNDDTGYFGLPNQTGQAGLDTGVSPPSHRDSPQRGMLQFISNDAGGNFVYANPNAFTNPNQANIYAAINQGMQNSYARSPTVGAATLAPAQTFNGANLQTGADAQYASGQNKYINALADLAAGRGPSVADLTAKTEGQRNLDATMALLGSQRGASNPAVAQRAAATALAGANQTTAQNAEQGRVAEELGAQGLVGQGLQTARGQTQTTADTIAQIDQATQQANAAAINDMSKTQGGLTQQKNIAQAQTEAGQNQLNAQQYAQFVQAAAQQNQQEISNQAAYQQMIEGEQEAIAQLNLKGQMAQDQKTLGIAGAGISAGAALLSVLSDKTGKFKIKEANKDLQNFLSFFEAA